MSVQILSLQQTRFISAGESKYTLPQNDAADAWLNEYSKGFHYASHKTDGTLKLGSGHIACYAAGSLLLGYIAGLVSGKLLSIKIMG